MGEDSGRGPGGYWNDVEAGHKRGLLIAAAAVVAVVGLGVVVWLAAGRGGVPEREVDSKIVGGPSESATAGGEAATAAPSPEATGAVASSAVATVTGREPYLAYRKDGALWVAREDGTGETRLAAARDGDFALSPDGRTLAAVDAARGVLLLVDVASKRTAELPGADDLRPSWAPDSSWVAYTTDVPSARCVSVRPDGTGARTLAAGVGPRVSLDGGSVAFLEAGTARLAVARVGGAGRVVPGVTEVSGYEWAAGGVLVYATPGPGPSKLVRSRPDGSDAVVLDTYSGARGAVFSQITPSPNGARIAYAETGDDGFSRLWAIAVDGSGRRYLSVRRDDYPVAWWADGSRIVFVQGNALQGETVDLMVVRPDGTARYLLVDGAGM